MPLLIGAISFVLLSLCWTIYVHLYKRHPRPPLPPRPPGDPLVGHLRSLLFKVPQDILYEWGKTYGDVMYLHVLGRPIIVLNTVDAAMDLLNKRSFNYSDRPRFVLYELMGLDRMLPFIRYGEEFQKHRRLMQQPLSKQAVLDYQQIESRETHILLQRLLAPGIGWDKFDPLIKWFATAIIFRITYGHQITSEKDPYIAVVRRMTRTFNDFRLPGCTLVDFFPSLANLPSWFPGASKDYVRECRTVVNALYDVGFQEVKRDMAAGKARPCFLTYGLEALEREESENHDILDLQAAAATMYVAGSDTTYSALSFFVLSMVLFPAVQERAQEEIDAVIGHERLPEFSDRQFLPFVECILQETLRWHTVVPLGVPHCSLENDVYKGMLIPKGSLIIANAKAMMLDERIYKDPRTFDPTRYLPKPEGRGEPFPQGPFGFGRRVCPGRHLADASVWIGIVSILATYTIHKALDSNGEEITPEDSVTYGLSSQPKPFQCRIHPRNEQAEALILNTDTSDDSEF